jgi:hypothetical protein
VDEETGEYGRYILKDGKWVIDTTGLPTVEFGKARVKFIRDEAREREWAAYLKPIAQ